MMPVRDPTGLRFVDVGAVPTFAVMSDIHVRRPGDVRSCQLVDAVGALDPATTDTLFLLGDVFDFIYAGSAHHRRHWKDVFDALRDARARGIKVHFCEGNHDFGFEHALHADISACFDSAGDVVFTLQHPVLGRVWLRHGDDVVCPPGYGRFRALVKARAFQKSAGLVPGLLTNGFFSSYARLSRTRDKYRALDATFFRTCLGSYFKLLDGASLARPDVLVIGHVHVNVDAQVESVRVVAGPDWFTAPQVTLVSAQGALQRRWLTPDVFAAAPAYPL